MGQKICCGGFELGEGLELDGRTLKATGGSGLPDPSALTDGTAMVAVNGEWKMQDGYGYINSSAFEIEWDGNTEGKISILGRYYKVSDQIIDSKDKIIGSELTSVYSGESETNIVLEEYIQEIQGLFLIMDNVIIAPEDVVVVIEEEIAIAAGVYFVKEDSENYTSKLVVPASYTKFNKSLIPFDGKEVFAVNFAFNDTGYTVDGYIADKTFEEIAMAANANKIIEGYFPFMGGKLPLQFDMFAGVFYNATFGKIRNANLDIIVRNICLKYNEDTEVWEEQSSLLNSIPFTPFDEVLVFTLNDGSVVCNKSVSDIQTYSNIKAYLKRDSQTQTREMQGIFGNSRAFNSIDIDATLNQLIEYKVWLNNDTWNYSETRYTLTPTPSA